MPILFCFKSQDWSLKCQKWYFSFIKWTPGCKRQNQSAKNEEIRLYERSETALPDECIVDKNFGTLILALSFRRSRFRRSDLDPKLIAQ